MLVRQTFRLTSRVRVRVRVKARVRVRVRAGVSVTVRVRVRAGTSIGARAVGARPRMGVPVGAIVGIGVRERM